MVGTQQGCSACSGSRFAVVAVAHHGLRQLIVELLRRDHTSWQICALASRHELAATVAKAEPDLVILDIGDFARFCDESLPALLRRKVVVIGPEPDQDYKRAALAAGAGSWLPLDRVAEDLGGAICRVLDCSHNPTQPAP